MKRWRLLFEFYQKNGIAVLFLLLLMTVSLFFFVQFLGYLGYQTYSLRIMDQLGFQDGAYFMAAEGYDEWQRNENIAYQALRKQEFPAVKSVTNPAYTQGMARSIFCFVTRRFGSNLILQTKEAGSQRI